MAVSDRYGYLNEAASARPVHAAPMAAAAPQAGGRQLNATEPWSIGGPAQQIMSRVGHMTKGITEARDGTLPAAAGGMGEAAEGVGAVAEEAVPLALAAL